MRILTSAQFTQSDSREFSLTACEAQARKDESIVL